MSMVKMTLYHEATGEFWSEIEIPETQVEYQRNSVIGWGFINTHYVDVITQKLCEYSLEELAQREKVRRTSGLSWKMPDRIIIDLRTINNVRTAAWERIKSDRDNKLHGAVVEYAGESYQWNLYKLATHAQLATQVDGYTVSWTTADNKQVYLHRQDLINLMSEMSAFEQSLRLKAEGLRAQIMASDDREQLDQWGQNGLV
ncbi:hypothetical protein V8J88_03815 [Massilia sp. W12]|uniref:DUF4376 domain-containing protein n=1 Tax=Massilia sp. W12 TaxID=3126507 RepID=UPI0030CBD887